MYQPSGSPFVRSLFHNPDFVLPPAPAPRRVLGGLYKQPVIETNRLILRRWQAADISPLMALNRDPEVMRFFNGLKSPIDCLDEIEQQERCFDTYGYGMWVLALKECNTFIGTAGIEPTMLDLTDKTARLSWKLARAYWGSGYATEAVRWVMAFAHTELAVRDVIALVDPSNLRSLRLANRLGIDVDNITKSAA